MKIYYLYCAGGKIKMNEMGRTCGEYGGGKRGVQGCWWGNLRERGRWGDPDVHGRILRWMFRKLEGVVGTGWSWLRIGTGGGHLLVSTVKNLRVP
jgi:hypothetical protein